MNEKNLGKRERERDEASGTKDVASIPTSTEEEKREREIRRDVLLRTRQRRFGSAFRRYKCSFSHEREGERCRMMGLT